MLQVKTSQFDWRKKGGNTGVYIGTQEASTLKLPPGRWPGVLIVEGVSCTRIFHDHTLPHPDSIREADKIGHTYDDGYGNTIHILND